MRFVISEEEKSRIRSLYESTPPDEYEVLGYINPFKDTKYLPFAGVNYSKDLKDGDLFYNLEDFSHSFPKNQKILDCVSEFTKKIKPDFSEFIGKTYRSDDDIIVKIKGIEFFVGAFYGRSRAKLLYLSGLKNPEDSIPTNVLIISEDEKGRGVPENLLVMLKSKLPKVTAKDLPDCLFELKKVKRVKTDFQP